MSHLFGREAAGELEKLEESKATVNYKMVYTALQKGLVLVVNVSAYESSECTRVQALANHDWFPISSWSYILTLY